MLDWTPLAPLLPEIVVALGAMALLMYGVFRPETDDVGEFVGWLAIGVLVVAAALVLRQGTATGEAFDRAIVVDPFVRFMKLLVLAGSALALVLSFDALRDNRVLRFEYSVLILLATVGMMIMVSANDLISLYVGLELQSLALYVVAAYQRDSVRSSEAGLKYFVLGALSSGMLLYGSSLVYGFTGSVSFDVIARVASSAGAGQNAGLVIGLVFVLVGVAFKIAAVPFHMWTPDVYEGAPTPVAAFFSGAPKIAAMALLCRVLLGAFPGMAAQWQQIVVFIAIASMLLGAFAAIGQSNIKRLMAYSSIANVGFALVGLAPGTPGGTQGMLIYMVIYMISTIGVFACILCMRRADGPVESIDELSGLANTNLPLASVIALLMFSLAGIPPLAGFWSKFYVFLPAIESGGGLVYLAVIGVVASVIAAYYYLRIVKIMFFDEAREKFLPVRMRAGLVLGFAGGFALLAFLPAPYMPGNALVEAAAFAAKSFRY